jgi:hypothetical protein
VTDTDLDAQQNWFCIPSDGALCRLRPIYPDCQRARLRQLNDPASLPSSSPPTPPQACHRLGSSSLVPSHGGCWPDLDSAPRFPTRHRTRDRKPRRRIPVVVFNLPHRCSTMQGAGPSSTMEVLFICLVRMEAEYLKLTEKIEGIHLLDLKGPHPGLECT